MGRPVSFDFTTGGGSPEEFLMGTVHLEPTLMHTIGNTVVLPDAPYPVKLVNGKAVHPNVAVSPAGPEPAWAYKVTIENELTGKAWSEFRGVPTGTTQIAYKELPKFVTTIPPHTTAGMMQNWADTAQDGASRAETAADRAEAPTDLMNKNLIENPTSLTAAALSAASVMAITSADEKVLFVTPRGNDANNGLTLKTAKATIPSAIGALGGLSGRVQLGYGSISLASTVELASGQSIDGISERGSVITYTGTGKAFTSAIPGVRTYNQRFSRFRLVGPGKTSTATGIELESMTDVSMEDVTVASFGVGVASPSTVNGGAVYNQFRHVTASSCGTGFRIGPMGSNSNIFYGCRANACTIGMDITDANHVAWFGGAFEVNTTGIKITATQNAFADANMFYGARFESNTVAWEVTSANVRDFQVVHPATFDTYTTIDNGTRTTHVGNFIGQNYERSSYASDTGTWVYERTINGGTELPAFVVRDSVDTSGNPVTIQAETERPTGWFFRGKRGGTTYWDVDAIGNMRFLQGGYAELTERSADPVAPAANALRFYAKDVGGKTALFVRFATGSPVQVAIEP